MYNYFLDSTVMRHKCEADTQDPIQGLAQFCSVNGKWSIAQTLLDIQQYACQCTLFLPLSDLMANDVK